MNVQKINNHIPGYSLVFCSNKPIQSNYYEQKQEPDCFVSENSQKDNKFFSKVSEHWKNSRLAKKAERLIMIRTLSKELKKIDSSLEIDNKFINISETDDCFSDKKKIEIKKEDSLKDITSKIDMCGYFNSIESKKNFDTDDIKIILNTTREDTSPFIKKILKNKSSFSATDIDKILYGKDKPDIDATEKIYDYISNDKHIPYINKISILAVTRENNKNNIDAKIRVLKESLATSEISSSKKLNIIFRVNENNADFISSLIKDKHKVENISLIDKTISENDTKLDVKEKTEIYNSYKKFMRKKDLYYILATVHSENKELTDEYLKNRDKNGLDVNEIVNLLRNPKYKPESFIELNKKMGKKDFKNLSWSNKCFAVEMVDFCNVKSIDSLSDEKKFELLQALININVNSFDKNNIMRKYFPLIPDSAEEYCKFLPKLAKKIENINPDTNISVDNMKNSTYDFTQKILEHPKFNDLSISDKKVMILSSLCMNYENKSQVLKLAKEKNLEDDERYKLLALYKTKDWVKNSENSLNKLKSIRLTAYDLRFDNLAQMAVILSESKEENVSDKKQYLYSCVNKFRKTQPILPQTKIPKSSRIKEVIKNVDKDGKSDIKGVYVNKNGLVILNYNEIEDWEKIGFPKGSTSKGIKTKEETNKLFNKKINTGNIKFIVHGLDYEDDLARFDAFNMVDSDALLSVSYTERPESKYRFFRIKGLLLDVDTRDIHGGGKTDSGSGYKKTIEKFKQEYILGGKREDDRNFISDMVKNATGMSDEEYMDFVDTNRNKPFQEIVPKEQQEKLIKAYAKINSHKRIGDREYNEMFVTSPKVAGIYAYTPKYYNLDKSRRMNPFINMNDLGSIGMGAFERYALKHDIPMIIFGE